MDTYAVIPTMPGREDVLVKAAASLCPQVDALFIYLNKMDKVPSGMTHFHNIEYMMGPDRGSASRFAVAKKVKGYVAFCDDDLDYYSGYIKYMKEKVDEYARKFVIAMHGKNLNPQMYSFQGIGHGRIRRNYPCLETVERDAEVHMAGTGAMMYHTDTLQITDDDFKNNNLDDAEFSTLAQDRKVPIMVVSHKKGDLKYLYPKGETIWDQTVRDPFPLLTLINSHKWEFWTNQHD